MRSLHLKISVLAICLFLTGCATNYGYSGNYAERPQVQQFINQMVVKHNFDRQQLTQLFNEVRPRIHTVRSISKPAEALEWYNYKPIFVTYKRAQEGAEFWRQHAAELNYAAQRYGVPPQIIVAIIGVETRYGRNEGKFRVLDSLSTLSFDYPRRATYFRSELENFLLLSRNNPAVNPHTTLGSYAGAMGEPQFMPSSYRDYAVDATRKGYSDLFNNSGDVILSVANYFRGHGWIPGGPVVVPARIESDRYQNLPAQGKKPNLSLSQFAQYGVYPRGHIPLRLEATLVTLQGDNGAEYWLGFNNFYSIMRYNTSPLYAMAVYQLSEMIRNIYENS